MRAWLITGGAGFIGSNFVRMVAARTSAPLIVLDAMTYAGNLTCISDLITSDRVKFVHGNICDASLIAELFRENDIERVVHFAAESHVDRSILGPYSFFKTNVEGTYTLLEAVRRAWKNDCADRMFLHVSTDEVYGALQVDDPPCNEQSPYRPNSPYSASKASADHLVRAWNKTYDLPTIITNCSNNYGPWQFPEKLIPLMTLNAFENSELPVYGDGMQIRDWLHVEDHCEALLVILSNGRIGQTYVISAHDEHTNIDIVRQVCTIVDEVTGRPCGDSEKLVRHVADRPGHDCRYALDARKLCKELGWQPKHVFEKSLRDVIKWCLENQDWAKSIRSGEYQEFYKQQYESRLAADV